MSKFTSCWNKGFQMAFDNGFRLSVQWGVGNYSSRKNDGDFDASKKVDFWDSESAEIAVFNDNVDGNPIIELREHDMVAGWLSTDTVAKVMAIVQSAKTANEISKKCKALNL